MQREKMRPITCVLITCIAMIVLLASCGNGNRSANGEPVTVISSMSMDAMQVSELYTVQPGDTLLGIANKYIHKNTYGPRQLNEFAEGIREANPRAFVNGSYVRAGEVLVIKYWVRR